ncbi:hypothetical protein ACPWT1_06775 [Ramlibacter sp. MMS24-I3-19]|uniref:hypothetical protein n=1 Tax=Ramlibacter sp. MMS24-I3-19 TaxID=3416606 RepID=UPI003CFD00AD
MSILPLLLAGCAGPLLSRPDGPMFRDGLAPQAAVEAIVPGRSTRADVAARLGDADRVAFDSGYEVWVYRSHPVHQGQPELVLLFGPDGLVRKLRIKEAQR